VSEEKATAQTISLCTSSFFTSLDAACLSLIVLSYDADASRVSSNEKTTAVIQSLCPSTIFTSSSDAAYRSLTELPYKTNTSCLPSATLTIALTKDTKANVVSALFSITDPANHINSTTFSRREPSIRLAPSRSTSWDLEIARTRR